LQRTCGTAIPWAPAPAGTAAKLAHAAVETKAAVYVELRRLGEEHAEVLTMLDNAAGGAVAAAEAKKEAKKEGQNAKKRERTAAKKAPVGVVEEVAVVVVVAAKKPAATKATKAELKAATKLATAAKKAWTPQQRAAANKEAAAKKETKDIEKAAKMAAAAVAKLATTKQRLVGSVAKATALAADARNQESSPSEECKRQVAEWRAKEVSAIDAVMGKYNALMDMWSPAGIACFAHRISQEDKVRWCV